MMNNSLLGQSSRDHEVSDWDRLRAAIRKVDKSQ